MLRTMLAAKAVWVAMLSVGPGPSPIDAGPVADAPTEQGAATPEAPGAAADPLAPGMTAFEAGRYAEAIEAWIAALGWVFDDAQRHELALSIAVAAKMDYRATGSLVAVERASPFVTARLDELVAAGREHSPEADEIRRLLATLHGALQLEADRVAAEQARLEADKAARVDAAKQLRRGQRRIIAGATLIPIGAIGLGVGIGLLASGSNTGGGGGVGFEGLAVFAGGGSLVTGIALLATGASRKKQANAILDGGTESRVEARLAPLFGPSGAGLAITGSF